MTKIFAVWSLVAFFCLVPFSPASSDKGRIDLKVNGDTISVELREVPLKEILDMLEREQGIWFRGRESVLEEKVSVWFTDLPLEEGLRRILSDINHILIYYQDGRLEGLLVFGKKTPARPVAPRRATSTKKAFLPLPEEATESRNPFEAFAEEPRPGKPGKKLGDRGVGRGLSSQEDRNGARGKATLMEVVPASENPFADPFGASAEPWGQGD
jgi:hypothetical protein